MKRPFTVSSALLWATLPASAQTRTSDQLILSLKNPAGPAIAAAAKRSGRIDPSGKRSGSKILKGTEMGALKDPRLHRHYDKFIKDRAAAWVKLSLMEPRYACDRFCVDEP